MFSCQAAATSATVLQLYTSCKAIIIIIIIIYYYILICTTKREETGNNLLILPTVKLGVSLKP